MSTLSLHVRTPSSLVLEIDVRALRAEDHDGWFGVAPGRIELVAVLPPGLLIYRDADDHEAYVALSRGLLHVQGAHCWVMAREALASSDLRTVEAELERYSSARRERHSRERTLIDELAREALRRMAEELRR